MAQQSAVVCCPGAPDCILHGVCDSCAGVQVSFLVDTCGLLVRMKRKEILYKARQRRAAAAKQDGAPEVKKDI